MVHNLKRAVSLTISAVKFNSAFHETQIAHLQSQNKMKATASPEAQLSR